MSTARILIGDCLERLKELAPNSVDAVVCDPPYHLTSIVERFGGADAAPAQSNGATGVYGRASKGFMGQIWDGGDVAFRRETWAAVLRVLKPGGHLIAFSGTRTYHRMAVAIEDAGFEVRDMIPWHYGSGFPKSLDVSKAIDKHRGAERPVIGTETLSNDIRGGGLIDAAHGEERPALTRDVTAPATEEARQWQGWGTALKPATEPMCLARKPLSEKSVAANVLTWGTGALNIDGCRIVHAGKQDLAESLAKNPGRADFVTSEVYGANRPQQSVNVEGRWPANLVHDGRAEVVAGFPPSEGGHHPAARGRGGIGNDGHGGQVGLAERLDEEGGSAARYFYCAKADDSERGSKCELCGQVSATNLDRCQCTICDGCGHVARGKRDHCACTDARRAEKRVSHPTVKPVELMRWLVRLVTPKGGTVLDPFTGSGSTGMACQCERRNFIGCELSPDYAAIAAKRLERGAGLFAQVELSPPPESAAA